jgi:D-alanyl-D-alanine carboxypeptidase (penicillin-binding protein 5/6)
MKTILSLLLLLPSLVLAAPPVPDPPQVAAKSWLLIDFNSQRVLAEHEAEQRVEPASLTKLMTAYVVYQELKAGRIHLDDPVTVSDKAWRAPGSRMFIEVGSKVSVENLLKGMIIQSGNDASIALAEHVAGSEEVFVDLMNSSARRLGMTGTHFANCTGLPDPEHYTTARDLARVAMADVREFPEYFKWDSTKEFTYNGIRQYNRNKLLWQDESVDGMKTGHTDSAGYCLVATAKRNGMRLFSVVLGTDSEDARARESLSLLNYGFRFFETHRLYGSGDTLNKVRVWKGEQDELAVGPQHDLYVTIPQGQYQQLKAEMTVDTGLTAPVQKGAAVGHIDVTLAGEPLLQVPLVALSEIPEGGLWTRAIDSMLLWFE